MSLKGKQVVLGVTGGIAIYKSVELVSRLVKQGIDVHVIMTKNATEFVTPLTFETMSRNPVALDTFARPDHWEVEHIALAQRAQREQHQHPAGKRQQVVEVPEIQRERAKPQPPQ